MPVYSRRAILAGGGAALAFSTAHAQTPLGAGATRNHPDRDAAVAELSDRNWTALAGRFSVLTPQAALVLSDDLANAMSPSLSIEGLENVSRGKTIKGGLEVGLAWRSRGAGVDVTLPGALGFLAMLERAERTLNVAVREDANDGLAYCNLFRVHKGLDNRRALDRAWEGFRAAAYRPVGGLSLYGDAISAKWLGSEDECLRFARENAGLLPPASYGIIPDMHITAVVARTMSDDRDVAASAASYLQTPSVGAEIIGAHERFIAVSGDADPFARQYAHSAFVFAFLETRDAPRLRPHLEGLGGFRGGPLGLLDNADEAISRVRRALGLSAI